MYYILLVIKYDYKTTVTCFFPLAPGLHIYSHVLFTFIGSQIKAQQGTCCDTIDLK